MELLKKISDRELKLVIFFITIVLFIASYQLGYVRYHQKADRLQTENTNMRIQADELRRKQENKAEILMKTEENRIKAELLMNEFPAQLEQEGTTLLIRSLREYSGWRISQISYDDTTIFYSGTAVADGAAGDGTGVDTAAIAEAPKGSTGITGYTNSVSVSYQTTYEGLKKGLDYIRRHESRMNVTDLTAAFDHTTGNLTGTLSIRFYAVDGLGRPAQGVILPKVEVGTNNVFGSFEIAAGELNRETVKVSEETSEESEE